MRLGLGLLLLALLAGGVQAQDAEPFPIESGKINTNDAGVLDPGQVELQPGFAGFYSNRSYDENGISRPDNTVRQRLFGTQLTFGICPDFDVNLALGLATGYDSGAGTDPVTGNAFPISGHGLSDITLGTRWRFFQDEESGLSLAYLTYTTFPTGDRVLNQQLSLDRDQNLALGQEIASLQHRLVVQKEAGHWSLIADLGCQHPLASNGPGFEAGLSFSLAAGYQVTEAFQPLVEIGYNNAYYSHSPFSDSWSVTGGGTYYVTDDVRLNLGITQTVAGHSSPDGLSATFFVTIAR